MNKLIMFEYTTKKVGERRRYTFLEIKIWYLKFTFYYMRNNLKIEFTFDNWDKKNIRKKKWK